MAVRLGTAGSGARNLSLRPCVPFCVSSSA